MYKKLNFLCFAVLFLPAGQLLSADIDAELASHMKNSCTISGYDEALVLWKHLSFLNLAGVHECANSITVNYVIENYPSGENCFDHVFRQFYMQKNNNGGATQQTVADTVEALGIILPKCTGKFFKTSSVMMFLEAASAYEGVNFDVSKMTAHIFKLRPDLINQSYSSSKRSGLASPLSVAVSSGNCQIALCLLQLGANRDQRVGSVYILWTTPREIALQSKNPHMQQLFNT
jgi:hypothetical protein